MILPVAAYVNTVSFSGDVDIGHGGVQTSGGLPCLDVCAGLVHRHLNPPAHPCHGRGAARLLHRNSHRGRSPGVGLRVCSACTDRGQSAGVGLDRAVLARIEVRPLGSVLQCVLLVLTEVSPLGSV